ncbi:MAG: Na+/H+ antiporter NhaA [Alphaproteobacteria bacterium]|nr:Na+/H+ antiporter NhaA [Alphaproteobacteria bacterium]
MAADTSSASKWWKRDTTPGYLLVVATLISFVLLNGPTADAFHHLLEDGFARVPIGGVTKDVNLHLVINDALMVIFFLYVGLELKRETVEGPFKNPREAALPMFGAVGGMAAPALIYLLIAGQADPAYARGWAIPAATDIAFAIGVLSLLGPRIPSGLRLFLLALAIIDDLGAILVIAIFYTTDLVGWALGGAGATFVAMLMLNRTGVTQLWVYWALGVILWGFMLLSGVHATIAGVLAALAVPMRAKDGSSPLITAEHALKNWVQLAIMPIFAIVNAGVTLNGAGAETLLHPITLGIALGLLLGKPIGIMGATYLAAMLFKRRAPSTALSMLGLSFVAGIGFTMSLFIGSLAFGQGDLATPVRFGVLGGSLFSALIGLAILQIGCRAPARIHDRHLAREEDLAESLGVIEDIDPRER